MAKSTEGVRRWREKQLKERPEEYKAKNAKQSREYYSEHPKMASKQQARFKKAYDEDPKFRANIIHAAVVNRYGLTPTTYNEKLEQQDGHCALCEEKQGDAKSRLHVDHDHACCPVGPPKGRTCGECNRGLLCGPCNRDLGALEKTLKGAQVIPNPGSWEDKAMQYLASYKPTDTPLFDRLMTGLDEVANYLSKPTELQCWQVEQIEREFYGEMQDEAEARKMAENPTQLEKDFIW